METHLPTVIIDQLPLEVWAKVFKCLRPNSDELFDDARTQTVAKVMTEQAYFHQLKLVCSKFRDVFAEHPELSNEIIIGKPSSAASTFVPSILLWIQRCSVCTFNAFSGEQHHELVLGALAGSSSLKSVFLANTPAAAVCTLPVFKSLTRCDFDNHEQLDLSPLQALPSLEELYVSAGEYSNVPSAGRLATLWVKEAIVNLNPASMEEISFSCLRLYTCRLSGLHGSGLIACKALARLEIDDAEITAAHGYNFLQVGEDVVASVPAKMSELTCLTKLNMVLACSSASHFNLDWLYSIVSLRHLKLKVQHPFRVSEKLTQLVELTSIEVEADGDTCGGASYSVGWEEMQALKHLELAGPISFDSRILQLTSIRNLVCVKLASLRPCATDGTTSQLARLMYQLAVQCPQVQVHVDGELIGSSTL